MSFYGLEIAKSALFASQQGINLTGHNIANVGTEGYTRQRLILQSISPAELSGRFSTIARSAVGAGVVIQSVSQIRNAYVDRALRKEYSNLGEWETRTNEMEYMEALFDETSKSSISTTLSDFFDSVQELSKDALSKEIRTGMQQAAITMTETFNHYYRQLSDLQSQMNDSMKATVQRINEISTSIASYNRSIEIFELDGDNANDLRDQRNLLLDELSKLSNIEYSEDSNGRLSVWVGDAQIVNHTSSTNLQAVADQTGVVTGTTGFYRVCITDSDGNLVDVNYSGGELEGYRQLRDGNTADDAGIPYFINRLNEMARGLAKEFNAIHETGYTMAYGSVASHTGVRFFDVPLDADGNPDYSQLTAGNFAVSDEVINDVYQIAASDTLIDLSAENTQTSNNKIALQLTALTNASIIGGTSFEGYLKDMVVELAVNSAYSQNMLKSQQSVTECLETRKEGTSGVSVDEEMINLMKFQHMYSAASRVINVMDEALDKLINGTGLVGR
jgi:flagellar hook-associated protein 1 FlgK